MIEKQLQATYITKKDVEEYLQLLVGKQAWISCGYGGVIFLEIDGLQKHPHKYKGKIVRTLYSGEYRIFCKENWEFVGKRKKIDRSNSRSKTVDDYFQKIGLLILEKVVIDGEFDRTHFYFSGGYRWTIIKDDALDTFNLTLAQEKKLVYVNGNGDIELYHLDEYPEHSWRHPSRRHKRRTKKKTLTVQTKFFRSHYPGLFTLSLQKALEFTQSLHQHVVKSIRIDSATKFTINDEHGEPWRISIEELWQLKKDDTVIIDAVKDKFHFKQKLEHEIVGKKIQTITFDKDGKNLHIAFENNLTLTVLESDRFSRWDITFVDQGLYISSFLDFGLVYRAEYPKTKREFHTGDIYFDAILEELYFYRSYFGGGEITGWKW